MSESRNLSRAACPPLAPWQRSVARSAGVVGCVLGTVALVGCSARRAASATTQPGTNAPEPGTPQAAQCPVLKAGGEAPLIDDFDGDPRRTRPLEGRGGFWFDYTDGTSGHFTRERTEDTSGVLHVASEGFMRWGSGFGAAFSSATTQARGCPYDASPYTGIRLRARGQGRLRVTLADAESTPVAQGGACTRPASRCYDRPGAWVDLESEWRTYELPFCTLLPEGWGGTHQGVDPARLYGVHFRAGEHQHVEAWLDDLEFYRASPNATAVRCGAPCPLQAAPRQATLDPKQTTAKLDDQLTLHTFDQDTPSCGPLVRRYLSFVPRRLEPRSDAPILVMLHGSGANAESARTFMAHDRFDRLAERDGFIVVYGNAAPSSETRPDPGFVNTGAWRQGMFDDGQVDDVAYLQEVLADLARREVIAGNNPLYLTGISNGGGMVLEVAKRMPERVRGLGAVMPYDGEHPSPAPDLARTQLRRVLFVYTLDDPGMAEGYHEVLAPLPAEWAEAMGIATETIAAARPTPLPDRIQEGADYAGSSPIALRTRDSHVTQTDFASPDGSAQVRVLQMDHSGHFWPNPKQDTFDWVLSRWGLRNQDIDAADAVWDFLRPDDD